MLLQVYEIKRTYHVSLNYNRINTTCILIHVHVPRLSPGNIYRIAYRLASVSVVHCHSFAVAVAFAIGACHDIGKTQCIR